MSRYFIRGVRFPEPFGLPTDGRDSTELTPVLFVYEYPVDSHPDTLGLSCKAYSSDEYLQALYEHWFRAHTRDGVIGFGLNPKFLCRRFGSVVVIDSGELRDNRHLDELLKQAGIIKRPNRSIREFG